MQAYCRSAPRSEPYSWPLIGLARGSVEVGAAREQQVFQLVERDDDGDLQDLEHFHQHLEERQDQFLPAWLHLVVEFREAVGEEVGQIAFIADEGGSS